MNGFKWQIIRISSNIIVKFSLFLKGIKHGENCQFYGLPNFLKSGGSAIVIGKNCTFRSLASSNLIGVNRRCIFSLHSKKSELIIGDNCNISAGVQIYTHDTVDRVIYGSEIQKDSVCIGRNVYIGPNVVISKGVHIGDYVIIGANSFVNSNIPSKSKAYGTPAKVFSSRNVSDEI